MGLKLLWVDLEMSGLDPKCNVILEVAAIVTNLQFEPLTTYHSEVHQGLSVLEKMDDWNKQQHKKTGLWNTVLNSKKKIETVEQELLDTIAPFFSPNHKIILSGNTIHHDKLFIHKYMTSLAEKLHYRVLDVSSWKLIYFHKYNVEFKKKNTHRALEDIQESVEELKFYLQSIQIFKNIPIDDDLTS